MNRPNTMSKSLSVLLFDPRVEGHHTGWIHYLASDLVAGGYEVTLACDWRPKPRQRLEEEFGEELRGIPVRPIFNEDGRIRGNGMLQALKEFHAETRADFVFLCNFNELASSLFRKAAVGILPPPQFFGCLGGVYHRPTMLLTGRFHPNHWLKRVGFRRLARNGWFSPLFFTDEWLLQRLQTQFPKADLNYLVIPGVGTFDVPKETARQRLQIPEGKTAFLFYGGPYRRKGLHLVLHAFEHLPPGSTAFLICAGDQSQDPEAEQRLKHLEEQGRARVIAGYVSNEMTTICFCAADAVLLPYIGFLVISGVMAQACAAGRPVIASDEGWLGRQVRRFDLGLLFPTNNAAALLAALNEFIEKAPESGRRWSENGLKYTEGNSRQVFREQLLGGFSARRDRL